MLIWKMQPFLDATFMDDLGMDLLQSISSLHATRFIDTVYGVNFAPILFSTICPEN